MFKHAGLLLLVALALTTAGTTAAQDRAVIRFADYGGIENWRAGRDGSLLIEARNGNWYRATFHGSCHDLKFAQRIGFVTDVVGNLDKFSSILVDGRRCWFRTFEQVPDPDAKRDGEENDPE